MSNKSTSFIQSWEQLAYHSTGTLRWLLPILYPASLLYGAGQRVRRGIYSSGFRKGMKAAVPVISVGNITVGGVGKTPFTMHLAHTLQSMGYTPAILFRGYKRQSDEPIILTKERFRKDQIKHYGDEPAMVNFTGGITCGIYRMRSETANRVTAQNLCDILLLDDGLQHLQLQRDLDIVLLDGNNTAGNKLCLPAGPLREPLSSLSKVDAVVFRDTENTTILPTPFRGQSFLGSLQWQSICPLQAWANRNISLDIPAARYHSQSVMMISGIGNPTRLEQQAKSYGLHIAHHVLFPDHHWINAEDIIRASESHTESSILITEKDAIRLLAILSDIPGELIQNIYVIKAKWQMQHENNFKQWLQETLRSIT